MLVSIDKVTLAWILVACFCFFGVFIALKIKKRQKWVTGILTVIMCGVTALWGMGIAQFKTDLSSVMPFRIVPITGLQWLITLGIMIGLIAVLSILFFKPRFPKPGLISRIRNIVHKPREFNDIQEAVTVQS